MIDEKLSAFLDGEADKDEVLALLRRLEKEPALRATLDLHQHVRACMRTESTPSLGSGFADHVMASIAAEDAAHARGLRQTGMPVRRHIRTLAGLAMAASVAGFAIFALQSFPLHDFAAPTHVAENVPATTPLSIADIQAGGIDGAGQPVGWEQLPADAAEQLNSYLISHNNYATEHGVGGPLGFMRVATYGNDEDTQPNR